MVDRLRWIPARDRDSLQRPQASYEMAHTQGATVDNQPPGLMSES